MDKHYKFTLREWAMTTGEYEWKLPLESEIAALPCLTMIGEAFDDGRYRQVSFEATTPNCRVEITRSRVLEETETQTFTFTVWPEFPPTLEGF